MHTLAKKAGLTDAAYLRKLVETSRDVDITAVAQAAADGAARATYKPDPSTCTVLPDGRVAYEAMSLALMAPAGGPNTDGYVVLETIEYDDDTGFPGVPATRTIRRAGVERNFQPERIELTAGFALLAAFGGGEMLFKKADGSVIPPEALAPDQPQPKYRGVRVGSPITLNVRNCTGQLQACHARVIGREP